METRSLLRFLAVFSVALAWPALSNAGDFGSVPAAWKWISGNEVVFTYDRTYTDSTAFSYDTRSRAVRHGVQAPGKYRSFPVAPEGGVNLTYSPDSSKIAFTRDNDLYVIDIATGKETRLTHDGSELILNGYASWVYYEEIFGRSTLYKAFWWSPDSRRIGFYRFDNTGVPLFPIYSPFGQDGSTSRTRYPKAGETNPSVRIGIADISGESPDILWVPFDENPDQYFGTPFWDPSGEGFYVSRMPRSQQSLELYRVDAGTGEKTVIYEEKSRTWVDWISDPVFTGKGLYMSRCPGTDWAQVYFLSYDGSEFRQLSDGEYWNISIVRVDERKDEVYFLSDNPSHVRRSLYRTGKSGDRILTDPDVNVESVAFSPDGRHFAASFSNSRTPVKVAVFDVFRDRTECHVVADLAGEDFDASLYSLPQIIYMETADGFVLPAAVTYPEGFDGSRKYPVHFDIYGGPDTPMVKDVWKTPTESSRWWAENGIIQVVADCRASGHNGRRGLDMVYRRLTVHEMQDFMAWADYMKSLPYVDGSRIGVEGFSFGGTMAAMLVMRAPDRFQYGIAGGGVYDWALYDTHYTERYMGTPQGNPDGYREACTLLYVKSYPASCADTAGIAPVYLKLTHGTGDDNVHFQNTLQLVNALQRAGRSFELMVYPDGKHGYGGYQGEHFRAENRRFWTRYLLQGR
ncbi:MAG: DPP IV N-terminal domain-containing protein [Bacteroidetes bacterium]|uniref:DPP IV N-terminal domain-containing protein n=1 Tax=Candidatus Cryptobacteroides merdigallinarum TaxID=2840770 RepID=A0A9D9EKU6_9BACT|nr:DPP IV N-terminal domain-containing protein [Candidatus Cryptobacteroides merdigallinarum]